MWSDRYVTASLLQGNSFATVCTAPKGKASVVTRICHLNALGVVAEIAVKLTTERLSLLSLDAHNLTWSIDFVIGELGSLNRTNYLTISVAHRISDVLVSRNMDSIGFNFDTT